MGLLQQYVVAFASISLCSLMLQACAPANDVSERFPEIKKIDEALSAAPPSIVSIATVRDWDGTILRIGSDEWVCFPRKPDREGLCPMCLDPTSQRWMSALLADETPSIETIGIGYRAAGDCAVSADDQIDEFTMSAEEGGNVSQLIMILTPDHSVFEKIPSDPDGSRPYVMWRDTPYAHVVAPLDNTENSANY